MNDGDKCSPASEIDAQIRTLYTELAQRPDQDFGWRKGKDNARQLGYRVEWLTRLPDVVWESAAAVGNPFLPGPIHSGETVVDLGCGAGADACVAALLVGATGKVYGFDATPAMVVKAKANAVVAALPQVEFRVADMARLELPDAVADVIISNGAINLALDKSKVFAEAWRVLRGGGRLQFADMVREQAQSLDCSGKANWADCVSGTLAADTVLSLLRAAGFVDVVVVGYTGYKTSVATTGVTFRARKSCQE